MRTLDQWLGEIVALAQKHDPARADEIARTGERDALQAIIVHMDVSLRNGAPGLRAVEAAENVYEILEQLYELTPPAH